MFETGNKENESEKKKQRKNNEGSKCQIDRIKYVAESCKQNEPHEREVLVAQYSRE